MCPYTTPCGLDVPAVVTKYPTGRVRSQPRERLLLGEERDDRRGLRLARRRAQAELLECLREDERPTIEVRDARREERLELGLATRVAQRNDRVRHVRA